MQDQSARAQPTPWPSPACDSHVHLFVPDQFPYDPARRYTPPPATAADLLGVQARLAMERVVLVQPSCYGLDNRALLDGLAQLGPARARGVAVVDLGVISDAQLRDLNGLGVCGIRFNLSVQQGVSWQDTVRGLALAQERCEPLGWHLQINADAAGVNRLAPAIEKLRIPVVFDHFAGGADAAEAITRLLRTGHVWIKLSAPYRASRAPDYGDLSALAKRLAEANVRRLLWGSDWPHTGGTGPRAASPEDTEPFRQEDALATLNQLQRWLPDAQTRHHILVRNPESLYGF